MTISTEEFSNLELELQNATSYSDQVELYNIILEKSVSLEDIYTQYPALQAAAYSIPGISQTYILNADTHATTPYGSYRLNTRYVYDKNVVIDEKRQTHGKP